MQIVAEKRVLETSENDLLISKEMYLVEPVETVDALLRRIGMTGQRPDHFSLIEVRLKLVRPNTGDK